MGINPRMGGLANRVIIAERSPRQKERCLFIGKRSKWAIVRHWYKAVMGDSSARVKGKRLWPFVVVIPKAWVPTLGVDHANGADVGERVDVDDSLIVGRW
jgi:hypothetical protein